MFAILSSLFLATLFISPLSTAALAGDASVELFSPQGTVKSVRQATAHFSEPMVPFGDPRIADPFDIVCPDQGKGRWADSKNWVYDFDKDLPAGVQCSFSIKPYLKALSGNSVMRRTFFFSTGGPAIINSRPNEGNDRIDEEQIFMLTLDAPALEESILANAYCAISGISERIGVKILKGEERGQLLRAEYKKEDPTIVVLQCRQSFRGFLGGKTCLG